MNIISFFQETLPEVWNVVEPVAGITGLIYLAVYLVRIILAKRRKYKNKGDKDYIIALQIGRPIAEAVRKQFGEIDTLIDVKAVLKKESLEHSKDYSLITKEVYKALAQNQDASIKLIVSGPVGLNVLIGQLIGLEHFDIDIYQYDAKLREYLLLPQANRMWLNHIS